MPRPLSFFKVYGPPFDPAREAIRRGGWRQIMVLPPSEPCLGIREFIESMLSGREPLAMTVAQRERLVYGRWAEGREPTAMERMITERHSEMTRQMIAEQDGGTPYHAQPRSRMHIFSYPEDEYRRIVEKETKGGFRGRKRGQYWPAALPVIAAVDWSPPEIRPGCEFQREPAVILLRNSFV